MTHAQRLQFAARHFNDLQTIRFAPVPLAMLLAPALQLVPDHPSRAMAWTLLAFFLLYLSTIAGFYWWSTKAIRRRYGEVKKSTDEALRMRYHPVIFLLSLALALYAIAPHKPWPFNEVYAIYAALSIMLVTILDPTNLRSRRIAWAIGLVILFGAAPFLVRMEEQDALCSLAGAVWLSLSTFDFLLLRQVLSETPPPPASITDAVMRHV